MFLCLLLLLSLHTFAETEVATKVTDIDFGTNPKDEILVLLESGLVAKIKPHNVHPLVEKLNSGQTFVFLLDEERYIQNIAPVQIRERSHSEFDFQVKEFKPTVLPNLRTASRYFSEARLRKYKSECFNRAMVWSYEWWKKRNTNSEKVFLFFTRAYIRRYNFKWWFHVAPMVKVKNGRKIVERMMDRKYSKGPLSIQSWTNIFMHNNAKCKPITNYSDYADFPYTGDCYVQSTHMYTYQPADLQMYEAWGYDKNKFEMREVRQAYLDALNVRIKGE